MKKKVVSYLVEKNEFYSFIWGAYGLQPDFEVKIGDIYGNGKNNIVVLNRKGLLIIYEWNGNYFFPVFKVFIGRKFDKLLLADIDGDGIADIILGGKKTIIIYSFRNYNLTLMAKQMFSGHITSLAVGDIDNDCKSEIAVSLGVQIIKIFKYNREKLIVLDKIKIAHPTLIKIKDVFRNNRNQLVLLELSTNIGNDKLCIYEFQNNCFKKIKYIKIPYKASDLLNVLNIGRNSNKIVIGVKQNRKILIMDYVKDFNDCLISGYFSNLVDITSGDWDGDGYNELIIADGKLIYIYKWNGITYIKSKVIETYRDIKAIAVGDINNDGLDEIVVGTGYGEIIVIRDTFKSKSQFIVNKEIILPEDYPDIIKVSDVKINSICIEEKKVVCNKVIIEGYFNVMILYVAEPDRSVRSVETKVPFLHVIQVPGIMPNETVLADVQVEYARGQFNPADKREIEVVIIAKIIVYDFAIGHSQSLQEVADCYKVEISDLAKINELKENMILNKGEKIKLPPKI
jgi:hypothetical protein